MTMTPEDVLELMAGDKSNDWEEEIEVLGKALGIVPPCTDRSGHRQGADHRWQECPTYIT